MMKKNSTKNILGVVAMVILAAILVYFFIQLNRIEKKALAIQETAVRDAGTISAVVNFFNANVNAQQ